MTDPASRALIREGILKAGCHQFLERVLLRRIGHDELGCQGQLAVAELAADLIGTVHAGVNTAALENEGRAFRRSVDVPHTG